MAQVIIDDTNLVNIAKAIRIKNGETDRYKPSEMADKIIALSAGMAVPDNALVLEWECSYLDYGGRWDWFFEDYMSFITINEMSGGAYMFYASKLTDIPLEFKFKSYGSGFNCAGIYSKASDLKTIGKITNFKPSSTNDMFNSCYNLNTIPEYENIDYAFLNAGITYPLDGIPELKMSQMFYRCYSLRSIPSSMLINAYRGELTDSIYDSSILYKGFEDCYSLNEIVGLEARVGSGAITKNLFVNTFNNCSRVKNIIFNTNNGTAYSVNLSNQVIDLSNYVGYVDGTKTVYITGYNSGITTATQIIDDATSYDNLKDNIDSWTTLEEFSRYNRDSAVATINSLPDTSQGSNNIIKFRRRSGSSTDGGAINTMTEEQVAVAIAKGWTVSYI